VREVTTQAAMQTAVPAPRSSPSGTNEGSPPRKRWTAFARHIKPLSATHGLPSDSDSTLIDRTHAMLAWRRNSPGAPRMPRTPAQHHRHQAHRVIRRRHRHGSHARSPESPESRDIRRPPNWSSQNSIGARSVTSAMAQRCSWSRGNASRDFDAILFGAVAIPACLEQTCRRHLTRLRAKLDSM